MIILVINCGSSSIKYQLLDMKSDDVFDVIAKGIAEKIGLPMGILQYAPSGKEKIVKEIPISDHKVGMQFILDALTNKETGVLESLEDIEAVGHRIVQGGDFFSGSAIVDEDVLSKIEYCCDFAPLHNPAHLLGIRACQEVLPNVTQVVTFDTAFHQTMPPQAYMYGLPYEYYENAKVVGFDIETVNYIADYLGRTVEVQDIEFDAIINAVASGKADVGFAGFTVTEERKKSINFTTPYTLSKIVVIVRGDEAAVSEESFVDHLHKNFVKEDRWKFIVTGLCNTLIISFFAALLGILIGFVIAQIRTSNEFNGRHKVLNGIARVYLAVIRGTPMMIQLLIIYYIVFSSMNVNKILVAIVAFGVNSGAYVSEIIRSGIKGVDPGQIEAGRSLGLRFRTILYSIVYPQAFKNSLQALTNEFISLIKETSICGYIGLTDLTRGGDIIRSMTYEAMLPLLAVAAIYFILVAGLSSCVAKLEKRLKKNER